MKRLPFVALFLCLVGPSWANDTDFGPPTSQEARAAIAKFEEAKTKAAKPVANAEAIARKQYLTDLQHALNSALKSANLPASNWMQEEIDRVSGGNAPTRDRPSSEAAVQAWTRYNRSVERARNDVRPTLETARRQLIEELKSAQRIALSQTQDLKEANRIDREIAKVKAVDISNTLDGKVDLLALTDASTDAVEGKWQIVKGNLLAMENRKDPWPRRFIEFPITPPEEYDYAITYRYTPGSECYTQVCYAGGRQFSWNVGANGNHVCQFREVQGGNTPVKADHWLAVGHAHTSIVKVRKAFVEAYFDGKLVASRKTDYGDMNVASDSLRHQDTIGFGFWGQPNVVIESAELIEISGSSKLLANANP